MALRAKKPEPHDRRLKALMFGPAGVGKTTAAIQMPRPYVIDCEHGTDHYGDTIAEQGGAVFQTTSMEETIAEMRALAAEPHDYRTLVIDPFTPLWDDALEVAERKVGTDFGRHYGEAGRQCKAWFRLVTMLDMNVVVTCHGKAVYGDGMKILGQTFDGWKKLDYVFDLVFGLEARGAGRAKRRWASVIKSRLPQFPDGDEFEWGFSALAERYGAEALEAAAAPVAFAAADQVAQINALLDVVRVADTWLPALLKKADAANLHELTADQAEKAIQFLNKKRGA